MPEENITSTPGPEDAKSGAAAKILNLLLSKYFKVTALILVVGMLAASYLFLLRPKYDSVAREVEETTKTMQAEHDELVMYLSRLNRYLSGYEAVSARDKEMVGRILPPAGKHDKLFTSLEAMIKGRGLLLTSLDITPDAAAAGRREADAPPIDPAIGKIKIGMSVSGVNYAGLKDLLATIENNLNIMDVERLDWKPEAETANLEISTYYLK